MNGISKGLQAKVYIFWCTWVSGFLFGWRSGVFDRIGFYRNIKIEPKKNT